MLDPGVTVDGVEHIGPEYNESMGRSERLYVMAGNDSRLSVDYLESGWLNVLMYGPGEMHIHQLDEGWHSYQTYGGRLLLDGASDSMTITSYATDVTLRNVHGFFALEYYDHGGGNITIEDCDLNGVGYLYMLPSDGNVTIRNCTMVTDPDWRVGIYIVPDQGSSVDVRDCVFREIVLTITPEPDINWSLNVTDCTFEGRDCYLILVGRVNQYYYGDYRYDYYAVPVPGGSGIWGNTFSGDGAGIIIANDVRGDVLGDNLMGDGVSLFAHLGPPTTYTTEPYDHPYEPYGPYSYMILDCEGGTIEWPYRDYSNDRMNKVLVNVTSDPRGPIGPVYVDVVIYTLCEDWGGSVVVGFDTVRYDRDAVVIDIPDWTDLDTLIEALKKDVIIEDNWWTD